METQKFSVEWRDTDFLCVGGGIAGLMAAINAAEQGMDCVVLEKADTRRSGSGGLGNDHFICYIPEVHGDYATFISDILVGQLPSFENLSYYKLEGEAARRQVFFYYKNHKYKTRAMEEFLRIMHMTI